MAFRRLHIVLAILIMANTSTSFATDLRSTIANMEKQSQQQELVINDTRKNLTQKTNEIENLKNQNKAGFVSKLVLQKKLREAQTVSKELENLTKKQLEISQQLRKQRSNLVYEIDQEIQALTANKKTRTPQTLAQFQKLVSEKDALLTIQHQNLFKIPAFNISSSKDNKEDLYEKLQVVEDLQKNIQQKIALIKEDISEERSREFLRNEVTHFIDEENFFGEQSFISNGLNRKTNSKNLAVQALQRESKTDAPSSGTTPISPTTPEPSTTTTPQTTPEPQPVAVEPQVSSTSTSFQQPQQLAMFETLLEQIQNSIQENEIKHSEKNNNQTNSFIKNQDKKNTKKNNPSSSMEKLALSEKILTDLEILKKNINQKIHALE